MELFINNNLDAAYNLALEEVLTRNYSNGFLMLWRNANAIIVCLYIFKIEIVNELYDILVYYPRVVTFICLLYRKLYCLTAVDVKADAHNSDELLTAATKSNLQILYAEDNLA